MKQPLPMARIPDGVIERLKVTVSVQRLAEARGVVLMWTSICISSQKSVAMAKSPDGSSPSGHRVLKEGAIAWQVQSITSCYRISAPITRKLRMRRNKRSAAPLSQLVRDSPVIVFGRFRQTVNHPPASSDTGVVFDIVEVLLQRKQQ